MKIVFALALSFAAAVSAAQGLQSLDALIKAAGFVPEVSGGLPDVEYHSSYGPEKAFDGVTYSSNERDRWLGNIKNGTYLQYDIPVDFYSSNMVSLVSYRLYALSCAASNEARTPTSWSLYGRRPGSDEWELVDRREDVQWPFKTGNYTTTEEKYILQFDLPSSLLANYYQAFKFVPESSEHLINTPSDSWSAGLMEIEFLVNSISGDGCLIIDSDRGNVGSVSPGYGVLNLAPGTVTNCTAQLDAEDYGAEYRCAGYFMETLQDGVWVNGGTTNSGTSFTYTHDGQTNRLVWVWALVRCRLDAVVEYGPETLEISPAPDSDGFYSAGTEVTITPVLNNDPPSFLKRWTGDVPEGHENDPVLTVVMDSYRKIHAEFRRTWKFVPKQDGAPADTITDGNWEIYVQKDDATGTPGGKKTVVYNGSAVVSGEGVLDLSGVYEDTSASGEPVLLNYIAANSFRNNSDITGLIFGDGPVEIGEMAFFNCSALEFVEMPEEADIDLAKNYIFSSCQNLVRVKLSERIVTMPPALFSNCFRLKTVDPLIPRDCRVLRSAYNGCYSLSASEFDMGGLESIGYAAFMNCKQLTGHANLTNLLEITGEYAFAGCGITSAVIDKVESIPAVTFYSSDLRSVVLSSNLTSIGRSAFNACKSLEDVSPWLPDSVTNIAGYAFNQCIALKTAPAMENVEFLGNYAFSECSGMSGTVSMPKLVKAEDSETAAGYQFHSTAIENFYAPLLEEIPCAFFIRTSKLGNVGLSERLRSIGRNAFYNSSVSNLVNGISGTLTKVGAYAFYQCKNLYHTGRLTFPKGCEFGTDVFNDAVVYEVDLSATSISEVPDRMFRSVPFDLVILPETVTRIGAAAFANTANMKKIYFCGGVPEYVSSDWLTFKNSPSGADWQVRLYVPVHKRYGWTDAVEKGDFSDKPNYDIVREEPLIGAWMNKWVIKWDPPNAAFIPSVITVR